MGGGGGTSGEVDFPDYIENWHESLMGSSPPATFTLADVMNNALTSGGNPYSGRTPVGLELTEPNTEFSAIENSAADLTTAANTLDETVDWTDIIDTAATEVDVAGRFSEINEGIEIDAANQYSMSAGQNIFAEIADVNKEIDGFIPDEESAISNIAAQATTIASGVFSPEDLDFGPSGSSVEAFIRQVSDLTLQELTALADVADLPAFSSPGALSDLATLTALTDPPTLSDLTALSSLSMEDLTVRTVSALSLTETPTSLTEGAKTDSTTNIDDLTDLNDAITSLANKFDELGLVEHGSIKQVINDALASASDGLREAATEAALMVEEQPVDDLIQSQQALIDEQTAESKRDFASGMSGINAVHSSSFIIGMALIEREGDRSINEFTGQLKREAYQQAYQTYASVFQSTIQAGLEVEVSFASQKNQLLESGFNALVQMRGQRLQFRQLLAQIRQGAYDSQLDSRVQERGQEASLRGQDIQSQTYQLEKRGQDIQERSQELQLRAQALEKYGMLIEKRRTRLEERNQELGARGQDLEKQNQAFQERAQALEERAQKLQERAQTLQQRNQELQENQQDINLREQEVGLRGQDINVESLNKTSLEEARNQLYTSGVEMLINRTQYELTIAQLLGNLFQGVLQQIFQARITEKQHRDQALRDAMQLMTNMYNLRFTAQEVAKKLEVEAERMHIAGRLNYESAAIDIDAKSGKWDLQVMERGSNVLSAPAGMAALIPDEKSKGSAALAGTLGGVVKGFQAAGPVGAAAGGILGGLGGLLS